MSYNRTESCVATAYTILYGSANAAFGPAATDVVSEAALELRAIGSADGGGGGSITEGAGDGFESGSGSDGIGSSADEVSIVMCFVVGGELLRA